ncbi:MAG: hypothetical protein L0Z53_04135, partial [Acidobacteriales bacterium]|nr:hypothetical protein [Terriglobales bacterium]
ALFGAMSNATTIDLRSLKQVSNEFTVVRLDLQPDAPVLSGVRPLYPWLGPLVLALSLALLVWMVWARLSESKTQ